jgi:hypothetical protein
MGWPHLPLTPVGSPRRLNRACGGPARTSGGRHLGRRCRRAVSGGTDSVCRRGTPTARTEDPASSCGDIARPPSRRSGPRRRRWSWWPATEWSRSSQGVSRRPASRSRLRTRAPPVTRSTGVPGRSDQGSARRSPPVNHSRTAMPASSCSWSAWVVEDVPHRAAEHLGRRLRLLRRRPGATTRAGPHRPHHPCRRGDGTGSARPGRRDPASGAGLSCVRGCRPATAPCGRAGRPARGPARRAPSGGLPARAGHPPSARPA